MRVTATSEPVHPTTTATPLSAPRRVADLARVLGIWLLAIPASFCLTALPTYWLDLISRDDLVNVFTTSGAGRYARLAIFVLAWALVMAITVTVARSASRRLRSSLRSLTNAR
jgi:hypothetical protein